MTRAEKIAKIVEHYGIGVQMGVAQEECAELIQAISKVRRGGAGPETLGHLAEEVADTFIVCYQMAAGFGITSEVLAEIERKLDRQMERIARGDEHYEITDERS